MSLEVKIAEEIIGGVGKKIITKNILDIVVIAKTVERMLAKSDYEKNLINNTVAYLASDNIEGEHSMLFMHLLMYDGNLKTSIVTSKDYGNFAKIRAKDVDNIVEQGNLSYT
jgi:hypothetical protein